MAEQGEAYAAFIERELDQEHERSKALSDRAAAITTTSSAFLGLVLTLTVLVTGKEYTYSGSGALGVLLGLLLFVVAALLGFIANIARKYELASPDTLLAMVDEHWTDQEVDARNVVAYSNVVTIDSLRGGNNTKARLLKWGAGVQVAAVVAVILALGLELWSLVNP